MKWKRWLWTGLTVLWMVMIFMMSAAPGAISGRLSGGIAEILANWTHGEFEEMSEEEQGDTVFEVEAPLRKVAHFVEFAGLCVLLMLALTAWGIEPRKAFLWAMLIGVVYAIGDEVHQLFVPERSGQAKDVILDTAGLLAGGGLTLLLMSRKRKTKEEAV